MTTSHEQPEPALKAFEGQTSDGRRAVVTFDAGNVMMELDGRVHGPRSIVGSLVNRDGNGQLWTIGLGTVRADFTPDDHSDFNRGMAVSLIEGGMDFPELMASLVQMSATFAQAGQAMGRALDNLAVVAQLAGTSTPDFSETREQFDRLVRQHQVFLEHLAPRGWALAPILENPWRIHVIAADFITKAGGNPDAVDEWLAEQVVAHPRVIDIVGEIAEAPVRAIWQWAFMAGAAVKAMDVGLWGPAAVTWLTMGEGMWVELRGWIGASNSKFYKKGGLKNQTLTESLTRSRESLEIAHDYMSRSVDRSYVEPVDIAPTSRHGFLHGRISGISRMVHAAKAITVIDAILEQATEAIKVASAEDLETPPWI